MIQKLAQFTDIQAALVVGGLSLQAQAATLRTSPEIVVATPVSASPAPFVVSDCIGSIRLVGLSCGLWPRPRTLACVPAF